MDQEVIKRAVQEILLAIGEDPNRAGLRETPRRVAEMLEQLLGTTALPTTDTLPGAAAPADATATPAATPPPVAGDMTREIVALRNIPVYSFCEHHLLPFVGHAHLAYLPQSGRLAGFSDLTRLVDAFAHRLQLQERLTEQVADAIMARLGPRGTLVVIEAEQLCVTMRDPKAHGTRAVTLATRGAFARDPFLRQEAMALLGLSADTAR